MGAEDALALLGQSCSCRANCTLTCLVEVELYVLAHLQLLKCGLNIRFHFRFHNQNKSINFVLAFVIDLVIYSIIDFANIKLYFYYLQIFEQIF